MKDIFIEPRRSEALNFFTYFLSESYYNLLSKPKFWDELPSGGMNCIYTGISGETENRFNQFLTMAK